MNLLAAAATFSIAILTAAVSALIVFGIRGTVD
jgi:uncharacterized membrane protein YfcA